jgi:hypothetical protein
MSHSNTGVNRVLNWTGRRDDTLVGLVNVRLPSGIVHYDIQVHYRAGVWWASPSTFRPYTGPDGGPARTSAGIIRYVPDLVFGCKETAVRFSNGVMRALCEERPRLFAGGVR